jgi:hypothetical protein
LFACKLNCSCYISCSHSSLRVAYIDEVEDRVGEKKMETAYYSTLVKVALNKDSESADPVQNLDQVMELKSDRAMVTNT